jgi:hypothetical protein
LSRVSRNLTVARISSSVTTRICSTNWRMMGKVSSPGAGALVLSHALKRGKMIGHLEAD